MAGWLDVITLMTVSTPNCRVCHPPLCRPAFRFLSFWANSSADTGCTDRNNREDGTSYGSATAGSSLAATAGGFGGVGAVRRGRPRLGSTRTGHVPPGQCRDQRRSHRDLLRRGEAGTG